MAKRKSKGGSSGPAAGGWEGVYSGFILIMLCFFIMLCSFSKVAPTKMNKFVKSFVDSVDMFKGGFGFQTGGQTSDVESQDVGLRKGLPQSSDSSWRWRMSSGSKKIWNTLFPRKGWCCKCLIVRSLIAALRRSRQKPSRF